MTERSLPHRLSDRIRALELKIAYAPRHYEPGDLLRYRVKGFRPAEEVEVELEVEKYAGSGFAGQVYRIKIRPGEGARQLGLDPETRYGLKVYRPVSVFANIFRDLLFRIGFGFPFAPRCLEAASRSNALWQKAIRRAAGCTLGTETCISDVFGTLYDERLRSHGEIKEWVEGRPWHLEIDEFVLDRPKPGPDPDYREPGSLPSEYVAKHFFMARLVKLLKELGVQSLARQFEWSTWKSQPNTLKRSGTDGDPYAGVTAIDFQAGLALLPFLPMSPGDFRLIGQGIARGQWVQFDQGDVSKLRAFVERNPGVFDDYGPLLDELEAAEAAYRNAMPDFANHGFSPLWNGDLRKSIAAGFRETWVARAQATRERAARLVNPVAWWTFYLAGAVPLLGGLARKWWGRPDVAEHMRHFFRPRYFPKVLTASRYKALLRWHDANRAAPEHIEWLMDRPVPFGFERVLVSWIPFWWMHRALVDWRWALTGIANGVSFPFKLFFIGSVREAWLMEHLEEGEKEGMLSEQEAHEVREQIRDPFIQRYLKCLAVHVCTLPLTQLVAVLLGVWIAYSRGWTYKEGALGVAGLLAIFAVLPISPGSIARGLYVVYVVIRERDIRHYRVALLLSFWKYIGYLAFPIQMVKTYPTLSRFMASRWATGAVSIVPVFGENGALLQHKVFDLFYNLPVSLRRKWNAKRDERGVRG